MPEVRTHDPDGGGDIGRLVREALGETVRPIPPGQQPAPSPAPEPIEDEQPAVAALPTWADGEGLTFRF